MPSKKAGGGEAKNEGENPSPRRDYSITAGEKNLKNGREKGTLESREARRKQLK